MTYTHCRGCGRELMADDDRIDGLCLWASEKGVKEVPSNCTDKAAEWWRELGRGYVPPFDSMQWQVAVDEWLAATR